MLGRYLDVYAIARLGMSETWADRHFWGSDCVICRFADQANTEKLGGRTAPMALSCVTFVVFAFTLQQCVIATAIQ